MKRIITSILSIISIIYTLWYMHYGNPMTNSGALSKIGLTHHTEFIIWGILTLITLVTGITIAYNKLLNTKLYIPLLIISSIGMILTLSFDFDYDIKPDYYLHCIGSLAFSIINGIAVFLLFLLSYKKHIIFKIFTYITTLILLCDLLLLIVYKETSFIEVLPIFSGYIMLSITNLKSVDQE